MFSDHTMVSVNLKGTGVKPEVHINPADGMIAFGNIIAGESIEKTFTIKNVSSFSVNFNIMSLVSGVENQQKQVPFVMIPSMGTIKANEEYEVKILFQPDHVSNDYFDVLLIDIPNQIEPKKIYLRGQAYSRQAFIREYVPFEWRPLDELKKKYQSPLAMLSHDKPEKQTILLEYLRDEEAVKFNDYPFKAEQDRVRKVLIGCSRLLDNKLEKNVNFELNAKVS